jgi:hypothetical protein
MTRTLMAVAAGLILSATGCNSGQEMPKTYPAGGRVLYQNGQPMKGGSIQLLGEATNYLRIFGSIQEDGKFSLSTLRDRTKIAGAPVGEYRIEVLPPLQGEHKGTLPINVPATYKVEAVGNNQLEIKLNVSPP